LLSSSDVILTKWCVCLIPRLLTLKLSKVLSVVLVVVMLVKTRRKSMLTWQPWRVDRTRWHLNWSTWKCKHARLSKS